MEVGDVAKLRDTKWDYHYICHMHLSSIHFSARCSASVYLHLRLALLQGLTFWGLVQVVRVPPAAD